jgi:hypothetical protein
VGEARSNYSEYYSSTSVGNNLQSLTCPTGLAPGWDLQFIETWHFTKTWLFSTLFFGFTRLLIGALWCAFKHSIQDPFAIAGYFVALGAIGVGGL